MFYQSTEFKGKDKTMNKVIVIGSSGKKVMFDFQTLTSELLAESEPIPKGWRRMQKGEFEALLIQTT